MRTQPGSATVLHRLGDSGAAIAEIRARLHRLGLLSDPEGAKFDLALDAAVRQFQQDRGIGVDGIVGPRTFLRLEEARWRLGDRVLSYRPSRPMVGDDVLALQYRLTELGFSPGRADGIFGRLTDHAIREFQLNTGLATDGTAGPETFRALSRLNRTIIGGASAELREQQAFDGIRTGVTHKVVVLDAGPDLPQRSHSTGGLSEEDIASDIAARVEGRLVALGTTVLFTGPARAGHTSFDDAERASIANDVAADVVLSLHCDAHPNPSANGVAAFFFGTITGRGSSVAGRALADLLLDEIGTRCEVLTCGAHPKTWDLLRLTRMPCVHLDVGYLTNSADAARLSDPWGRDLLSRAITASLIRFFSPPPTD